MSNDMDFFNDENEDENGFQKIPVGTHEVILTNATLDETKPEARISVEFTISDKRKTWLQLRFGEKSKKFLKWQMRELGIYHAAKEKVAAGQTLARATLDCLGEIMGVACVIEIDYQEWKGRQYANVIVKECGEGHVTTPKPKQNLGMSEANKKALAEQEHSENAELPF